MSNSSPARLMSKLESEEADASWQMLIEHNSDSHDYYNAYLSYRKADMRMFVFLSQSRFQSFLTPL